MFKEVDIKDLCFNPFSKIGDEWMLISAGTVDSCNTMTASWGGFGVLWGKNAATMYIRQSRYTKEFVDNNDLCTLSFFDKEYKKALSVCGSVSGRDRDKIKEAELTPVDVGGTTAFEQASMVFVCRKIYSDFMPKDNFIDTEADEKFYSDKDYHTMYIAEIVKVLIKE